MIYNFRVNISRRFYQVSVRINANVSLLAGFFFLRMARKTSCGVFGFGDLRFQIAKSMMVMRIGEGFGG